MVNLKTTDRHFQFYIANCHAKLQPGDKLSFNNKKKTFSVLRGVKQLQIKLETERITEAVNECLYEDFDIVDIVPKMLNLSSDLTVDFQGFSDEGPIYIVSKKFKFYEQ